MRGPSEKGERLWRNFELSLLDRQWDVIKTSWIAFIPLIEPPGKPPPTTLSSILEAIFPDGATEKGTITELLVERAEIPEIAFREAIYWLHKAVHVLGASEKHIEGGLPTWSLSAGYQCGFFSARSILAFHGIAVGEHEKTSFVFDLCRDTRTVSGERLADIGAFREDLAVRSMGYLFGHKEIWLLFQRLVRTVKKTPWPEDYISFYKALDSVDLSRQRHSLLYDLEFWVMDDLCDAVFSEPFRDVKRTGGGKDLFDPKSPNFSIALGLTLSQMAWQLFDSLCQRTNRLEAERELLERILSPERHPFFSDAVRAIV